MRRAQRIRRIEAGLVDACAKARRKGVAIVYDAFEMDGGVCALGAANLCRVPLAFSKRRIDTEWDSIEMGFDGVAERDARVALRSSGLTLDRDFHKLGLRVRRAVKPIRAALLTETIS